MFGSLWTVDRLFEFVLVTENYSQTCACSERAIVHTAGVKLW